MAAILGRSGEVRELLRTLETRDPREAKARMADAVAWADGVLEAARIGAQPLTNKQTFALAGIWYRRLLHEWEARPALADKWNGWEATVPTPVDTEDGADDPRYDREWRLFLRAFIMEAEELLTRERLVTDEVSKMKLAEVLVQRLPEALKVHYRRRAGDYSEDPLRATIPPLERPQPATPTAAKQAPPQAPAVSLRGLFTDWKRVATVKANTAYEVGQVVEMVVTFLGHDDAARLGRDDLMVWRKKLKEGGLTNNTWNNRLSMLGQVLRRGIEDGKLTVDPTTKLRLEKSRPKVARFPYSDADAARILTACRAETQPSLRWAHWIMAFTGMRAGEVLQLTGGDVRNDGGVWFIAVHEDDVEKTVKTGQRRHVPLHDAVIAEGFVRYAQTIGADDPLFPEKKLDRFGNRGGRAWNVVGKWVRKKVGISDPNYAPDHSWRHRIEDEMRTAEVPEDVRDAITGRARKTTGTLYGVRGEALKRLARELNKVPVPAGV